MKKILLISLLLPMSAFSQNLVDLEAKKAKIQNAFDSVSLDIKQDEICGEKFSDCMDQVCGDPRVNRCICASYFDSVVAPSRSKLIKMQEQTQRIINIEIPALQELKNTQNKNSVFGDSDVEEIDYSALTANLLTMNKGDFISSGDTLFNKGLNSCKSIASSCSSTGLSSKITENYKIKVGNTCIDYLNHLNKEGEIIEYENMQALKMKKSFENLNNGGSWNLSLCESKIKEFFVKDCQGFDYKNCVKCKDINSEESCKKEAMKNFESKKTRASSQLSKNCGKENFESSFKNFISEVNGNFSINFRKTQSSSDAVIDKEIKDWTVKLTACVSSSCELDWKQCEDTSNIQELIKNCDEVKKIETRYGENNPDLITSVKKKTEIEILKKAKTRRQF